MERTLEIGESRPARPAPPPLERIGPYRVVRFIAEGGMAWVFEVNDPRFPRARRAAKVLKPEGSAGVPLELFHQEAQLLARVDHPNVVRVFDAGRDDECGVFYYTMSLIEGETLDARVERSRGLRAQQAVEILIDVLHGLEALHDMGVVHRDITPRNVILDGPQARPVLMDLGIARAAAEGDETVAARTDTIIGTPAFMSPEQASGRRVGRTSDVFSLGLCLVYALTGRTVYEASGRVDPRNGMRIISYLGHLVHAGEELDVALPTAVPRALRQVVTTACRVDPRRRYPHAREMRRALEAALVEIVSPRRRGRRLVAAGAAAALLAAGGLAASAAWAPRAPEPTQRVEATTGRNEPGAVDPQMRTEVDPEPDPTPRMEATLAGYRSALSACDAAKVRRVYDASEKWLTGMRGICELGPVQASLGPVSDSGHDGDRGCLCVEYGARVEVRGSKIDLYPQDIYRAELLRQPDAGWRITDLTRAGESCQCGDG